ncbi:MAG: thermosome subunit beta [Candidatus Helarchaeota archaeon]
MELTGRPMLIMKKKTQRMRGTEAQRFNILTACVIAELIRTTLGPHGFEKLIVDPVNDIIISGDGSTIMKNYDVRHPMAKIMDKLVRSMDTEVGDGSKTAMILVGEFLKKAQIELMDQGVHPSQIITGYQIAYEKVKELAENIAITIDPNNDEYLINLAKTSFGGKIPPELTDKFAKIALNTVKYVMEEKDGKKLVDIKNNVNIISIHGASLSETELIKGMAIKKELANPQMEKRIENAKIAVLEPSLELKKTKLKAKILPGGSLKKLKAFRDEDFNLLKEKVEKIKQSGANVVFARREVHDKIHPYLIKAGIIAAKWVRGWDMEKIAKATGAEIVKNLDYLTPDSLGEAGVVEELKFGKEKVIYVRECRNPKAVTIVIRAGIEHLLYEAERKINDALYVLKSVIENNKIVGGAGAFEMELSRRLAQYATKFKGREQLAIITYAKALEIIPSTLIENAGLNVLDAMAELRKKHEENLENSKWFGVDILSKKPLNTLTAGIIDPLKIKITAIQAATDVTNLILGIDDVIYAQPAEYEKTIEEEEAEEELERRRREIEEYRQEFGKEPRIG